MDQKNTRYFEKKILENTDRLVECAIAASLLGEEAKEKEYKRAQDLIGEMAGYLQELIEVKDEYLPEILSQIISQKLPDTRVQESLGTFTQELDRMLKFGLTNIEQRPQPDFEPEAEEMAFTSNAITNEGPPKAQVSQKPLAMELAVINLDSEDEETEAAGSPVTLEILSEQDLDICDVESELGGELCMPEPEPIAHVTECPECSEEFTSCPENAIMIDDLLDMQIDATLKECPDIRPISYDLLPEMEAGLDPAVKEEENEAVEAVAARMSFAKLTQPEKGLDLSLMLIFPGSEILRDVSMDGVSFAYYLPGKGLAIDQNTTPEDRGLKEKICAQENIAYYVIGEEDSKNPRRVERILNSRRTHRV
ncbi:MAG TPA: hypothetical protein VNU93_05945 [Verrucomicrobiae bacterium]|nr:hypothetical protein [Verrucomicrobiae bacterium]